MVYHIETCRTTTALLGKPMYLQINSCFDMELTPYHWYCSTTVPGHPRKSLCNGVSQYCKYTQLYGVIHTSVSVLNIDCYCDSDFVWVFGCELSNDSICGNLSLVMLSYFLGVYNYRFLNFKKQLLYQPWRQSICFYLQAFVMDPNYQRMIEARKTPFVSAKSSLKVHTWQ